MNVFIAFLIGFVCGITVWYKFVQDTLPQELEIYYQKRRLKEREMEKYNIHLTPS